MRTILCFFSTLAFYAALSGQFHNTYLMICGVVACAAITALVRHLGLLDEEGMPYEHAVGAILYIPWLLKEVFLANLKVARMVWSPKLEIAPRMVHIKHQLKTSFGIATYINSITLTPGTVTVDVDADEIIVHALTVAAAEDLQSGVMHERIQRLEGSQ